MTLLIPAELVVEKNKLFPGDSEGYFVELLEIHLNDGQVARIANSFEDVRWNNFVWMKFRFEPGNISEGDDGDDKSVTIKVSNIVGAMQDQVESDDNYLIGNQVIYYYAHTGYPNLDPLITGYFDILEGVADDEWITFELGTENFYLSAFPQNTYNRNTCWYKPNHSDICPYANSSACDKSFATCINLGKSSIFGGQPGIPGGVWVVDSTASSPSSGIAYTGVWFVYTDAWGGNYAGSWQ